MTWELRNGENRGNAAIGCASRSVLPTCAGALTLHPLLHERDELPALVIRLVCPIEGLVVAEESEDHVGFHVLQILRHALRALAN